MALTGLACLTCGHELGSPKEGEDQKSGRTGCLGEYPEFRHGPVPAQIAEPAVRAGHQTVPIDVP